jgi:putative transposase
MLGKSLCVWLKKVDEELTALAKHLQRQHIKPTDSPRYVNMNRRITEHVENEVNRCLNTVVALHNPAEIVAEALDFRYTGLSRRLNRILTRCGMGAMKKKLQSLHETLGITITYVPAAYTSQECSGCGFVNKTNRRGQARFVCGFCGKKLNADINASYTIRSRRSWPEEMKTARRSKVLSYLDHVFNMRWGISPARIRDRIGTAAKSTTKHSSKKRPTADGLNEQLNVSSSQLEFHSRELVSV